MSAISRTAYKRLVRDRARLRRLYAQVVRLEDRTVEQLRPHAAASHFGASSIEDFVLDWSCNEETFTTMRLLKRLGIHVEKRHRKAGAR